MACFLIAPGNARGCVFLAARPSPSAQARLSPIGDLCPHWDCGKMLAFAAPHGSRLTTASRSVFRRCLGGESGPEHTRDEAYTVVPGSRPSLGIITLPPLLLLTLLANPPCHSSPRAAPSKAPAQADSSLSTAPAAHPPLAGPPRDKNRNLDGSEHRHRHRHTSLVDDEKSSWRTPVDLASPATSIYPPTFKHNHIPIVFKSFPFFALSPCLTPSFWGYISSAVTRPGCCQCLTHLLSIVRFNPVASPFLPTSPAHSNYPTGLDPRPHSFSCRSRYTQLSLPIPIQILPRKCSAPHPPLIQSSLS